MSKLGLEETDKITYVDGWNLDIDHALWGSVVTITDQEDIRNILQSLESLVIEAKARPDARPATITLHKGGKVLAILGWTGCAIRPPRESGLPKFDGSGLYEPLRNAVNKALLVGDSGTSKSDAREGRSSFP